MAGQVSETVATPESALNQGLSAWNVSVRRGAHQVIDRVSLEIAPGEVVALCGANGSGKSTLLAALAGVIPISGGEAHIDGVPLADLSRRDVARRLAILGQVAPEGMGFTVQDLVELGRHAHRRPFRPLSQDDRRAITWAIEATGLESFVDRDVGALSGGERQRAHIAMALAQGGRYLLLDEPTTYLDPRHQVDILRLVRSLNRAHGITVLWVLHDLNQAAQFSDRVVLLGGGKLLADGPPEQALQPELIHQAFALRVVRVPHPETGQLLCVPSIEQANAVPSRSQRSVA